ncbi:MAG: alpha/beta hydrolase family protein [Dehalococcoidia bacterium]
MTSRARVRPRGTPRITSVAEHEGTLPYFLARPAGDEPTAGPALVLVHGRGRAARPLIEAFAAEATAAGYLVVAPVFEQARYAGYQRLAGVVGPRAAADALRRTVAELQRDAAGGAPIALVGFSGGAQFAHRFALSHPSEVERAVIAAAGWYTMPDPSIAYPHGLASSPAMPEGLPDLDAFLRVPVRVLVGEGDVARDANLNTSPALDEMQGRHRLERARRWVRAVRAAAQERGLPCRAVFEVLPGTGHSAREAIGRGGLVPRTLRFLASATT